jgi:hypothetical protein
MLKLLTGTAVALTLCTSGALGQTAWRGTATITAISSQCSSSSFIETGFTYRSVIRPRLNDRQSFKSSLTFLRDYAAVRIARGANAVQWTFNGSGGGYQSRFITGSAAFKQGSGTLHDFDTNPNNIVSTDDRVKLTKGTIENFLVNGCTVEVEGEYPERQDP